MKSYPTLNLKHFNVIHDYVVELDNQIWSLVDYIYNFSPNYRILNYTPQLGEKTGKSYYDIDELQKLKVITINSTEKTITAHINYLPQHFGIYNNFSNFPKNNRFWTDDTKDENNQTLKWPWQEGTVIISLAKNTLPIEDAPTNRKYQDDEGKPNYFIARLSAFATFYHFYFSNNNGISFNWEYDATAEEKYGTAFYTTLIPYQPRFLYTNGLILYSNDKKQEIFSYRIDNSQLEKYIKTQNGSQWTEAYLLNHEALWIDNTASYEDCICDDISWTSLSNLDNSKIPTYNINIKDGEKPKNIYINLW